MGFPEEMGSCRSSRVLQVTGSISGELTVTKKGTIGEETGGILTLPRRFSSKFISENVLKESQFKLKFNVLHVSITFFLCSLPRI